MLNTLTIHIWQSTLFAAALGLLTLAFRNSRAEARYWLWFSASLKFLVPFSLLLGLGTHLGADLGWAPTAKTVGIPAALLTTEQVGRSFPKTIPAQTLHGDWIALTLSAIWIGGFLLITLIRVRGCLRIRQALRSSVPVNIAAKVEVRACPGLLEPGVVGLFRPVLLLPVDIQQRLTASQLEAVIAHELCHVDRRDNLTSAVHMIVEAVFWFHPLVWWLGARLVDERERACDEAVLSLNNDASDYANAILSVCRSYLESPLRCVSGVTGANLKRRIQVILTGHLPEKLNFARKAVLSLAAITAVLIPVSIGILNAPTASAVPSGVIAPKFEKASLKPCNAYSNRPVPGSPGRLQTGCTTLQRLMQQAYGVFADGQENLLSTLTIVAAPDWTDAALYEIDAKASPDISRATMDGPMLQALLEDRFHLQIHHETRDVPVYKMTVASGGLKIQPFQGSCIPAESWDFYHPPPPSQRCGATRLTSDGLDATGETMADLRFFFLVTLDRPVIDDTRVVERFNFHLDFPADDLGFFHGAHGVPARGNPAVLPPSPAFVSAMKTAVGKLGLDLEPASGPGEFIVIDSVSRPSAN